MLDKAIRDVRTEFLKIKNKKKLHNSKLHLFSPIKTLKLSSQ